jgi:hypothetical protein
VKSLLTISITTTLALATPGFAQDVIWGLGFSAGGNPLLTDTPNPMHRIKDLNGDGLYTDDEVFSLVNVDATTSVNSFVPDMGWVWEDGRLTFYWSEGDNNEAYIRRAQDLDNNGVLEAGEVTTWFAPSGYYRDPEAISVHRNPTTNRTVVYIANKSSRTADRGIVRLEDIDGDGVIDPATEATMFVAPALGLTVPGKNGGTVTITSENFINLRRHPSGDLLAYAQGSFVTSSQDPVTGAITYGTNPDTFAWLRFADNGAGNPPTASIFMNMSSLNDMPQFADFANGTLPTADMNPTFGGASLAPFPSNGFHQFTFLDIDYGGGFAGSDVYYFASEARDSSGQGLDDGINPVEPVQTGAVFRAEDINFNGQIDPGELTLFAFYGLGSYGGLPTASTALPFTNVGIWDMSAANGRVQFAQDESVYTFDDLDGNGTIETHEVTRFTPDTTQGTSLLYGNGFGPFIDGQRSLPSHSMAGPFAPGFQPIGDGCAGPTSGKIPQIDAFGTPTVGSTFTLRVLHVASPNDPAFMVVGDTQVDQPIAVLPGCRQYSSATGSLPFVFPNPAGYADFQITIPNSASLVGASAVFQSAFVDSAAPANRPVPFYTSNGLVATVQ